MDSVILTQRGIKNEDISMHFCSRFPFLSPCEAVFWYEKEHVPYNTNIQAYAIWLSHEITSTVNHGKVPNRSTLFGTLALAKQHRNQLCMSTQYTAEISTTRFGHLYGHNLAP